MNNQIKHWIFSSLQTFLAGFMMAIIPFMAVIDWQHVDQAAIIGLIGAGVRGAIKYFASTLVPLT